MAIPAQTNAQAISQFAAGIRTRALPAAVQDAARFCVADWYGVALGARGLPAVDALTRVAMSWVSQGRSPLLSGGTAAAPAAALVNGMMAHCLDFDDTHVGSIAHLSGPTWAAAWAAATEMGASPSDALRGFIAGFEVGARLGNGGFGVGTNERHIHSTGVFGCIAAATAAACVYGLDEAKLQRAIGLACTQVGGLTASFGTPAKPFHAGKAAFNGVLSAQMAREGYDAATDLVEPGGGLDRAMVQDKSFQIEALDFSDGWELNRNTFKPYASCLLTHPVIDAGKVLAGKIGQRGVAKIRVHVHPLAIQLAGKPTAATPYEGKFSLAFTTALSLTGRQAAQRDFTDETVKEAALQSLLRKVVLVPTAGMALTAATLEVQLEDGTVLSEHTPLALGNPGRAMSWDDMQAKFASLTDATLGEQRTRQLFGVLRAIDTETGWDRIASLVSPA